MSQVHVSSGSPRQPILQDDQIIKLLEDMKPFLRNDQFDEAVHQGALEIGHALSSLMYDSGHHTHQMPWPIVLVLIAVGLVVTLVGKDAVADHDQYFGGAKLPHRLHAE